MKVFLIAYYNGNFGDDLFVCEIAKRYPDVQFYSIVEKKEYIKAFEKYKNLHFSIEKNFINKMDMSSYDACLYIGGSIFVESTPQSKESLECFKNLAQRCKNNGKPYFYMSSNFGPYETKAYYELAGELFKNCEDVCFRDKYSANLFRNIETVRYAPDVAFSLDFKGGEKLKDSVGISMLDVTRVKGLQQIESEYYDFLENNTKKYIDEGKNVYFFSFWKDNGEEYVADTLLERFTEEYRKKINVIRYRGDVEQFLDIYSRMEYMICIKFHSMVLSTLFNQKKIVLSYLSKLNNVNDDLKLTCNLKDLKDISGDCIEELEKFDVIEKERVRDYIELSKKQFEKFDMYVKKALTMER